MYFVYVLQSIRDPERHYVGLTNDLSRRLVQHNAGDSAATAKHRPWKVVVTVGFEKLWKAEAFEKYLKSGSGRAFCKKHF